MPPPSARKPAGGSPKPAESPGSSSPFFRPGRRGSDAAAKEEEDLVLAEEAEEEEAEEAAEACPKCSAGSGKLAGHKGRHLGATKKLRAAAAAPPVAAGLGAKRVPKEPEKFQSYDTCAETSSGKPSTLQAAKSPKAKGSVSAGDGMSLSLGGLKEALAPATTAQLKAELARREDKSTGKRGRPEAETRW